MTTGHRVEITESVSNFTEAPLFPIHLNGGDKEQRAYQAIIETTSALKIGKKWSNYRFRRVAIADC